MAHLIHGSSDVMDDRDQHGTHQNGYDGDGPEAQRKLSSDERRVLFCGHIGRASRVPSLVFGRLAEGTASTLPGLLIGRDPSLIHVGQRRVPRRREQERRM